MIGQDAVYGLAALVDEGTEACAKNSTRKGLKLIKTFV
jgi:hypothetical protein